MVLGADINLNAATDSLHLSQSTKPSSINARWRDKDGNPVIGAGGPATDDNSGSRITNPTAQVTNITTRTLKGTGSGTLLMLKLGYDDALGAITDVVVQVFGRTDPDVEWQPLENGLGNHEVTLTTAAATDVTDGTLKYTQVKLNTTTWDMLGCKDILVAIKTALAGTGVTSNSVILAKIVN